VADIYVELQNELYMTLSRQKTTGAGRFVFTNMSSGTYKIKVLVMGTNYLEQVKDVQILNLLQGSSDQEFVDFHLKLDPRKVTVGSNGQPENIFVQDGIPDSAQKLYRNGAELLSKGDEKGLLEIEKAIQLSPNYFDALNRASAEYVKRKEFAKALPHLVKEIDINRRSFSSFYNLAYVCYQLNHRAEAVEAARGATIVKPDSINAHILYGTVLRINGNYDQAVQSLLKAKSLGKDSSVGEIYWQLALVYQKQGRKKEQADALESFLKAEPKAEKAELIKKLIAQLREEK
jgi:tetratricopeptide (TPR) repeat protein